jgi:hypothetical protein
LLTLVALQDMFDAQITNICLGVQSIIEKMEAQGVCARVMDIAACTRLTRAPLALQVPMAA